MEEGPALLYALFDLNGHDDFLSSPSTCAIRTVMERVFIFQRSFVSVLEALCFPPCPAMPFESTIYKWRKFVKLVFRVRGSDRVGVDTEGETVFQIS